MTHADLLAARPTPGIASSACRGVLSLQWSRLDPPTVDPLHPVEHHVIELYRCLACETCISLDATAGRVLNAYRQPVRLVADLAEALDVKPLLPGPAKDLG